MIDDHDFDEMVDLCCKAHEAVVEFGTPEMRAFTTALLHALAKEATRRSIKGSDGLDSH